MNASLVVPTLDNEGTIRACLSSLEPQLGPGDELIVVDSFSDDDTVSIAKSFGATVFKTRGNRSVARNIGWRKAKNDVIIFVESDSIYDEGYVSSVKRVMEEEDVLVATDKRCHYKPSNWVSKVLDKEMSLRPDSGDFPMNAWIYKKSVLKDLNGFDNNLEYAEDRDLGIRLKQAGYSIRFIPSAVQYHLGEPSTLMEVVKRGWKYGRNMKPFYEKHGNTPWFKILLFNTCLLFPLFYLLIFLVNVLRYDKFGVFDRIRLSFISLLRWTAFSVSFTIGYLHF